jgi:hypothetical protein
MKTSHHLAAGIAVALACIAGPALALGPAPMRGTMDGHAYQTGGFDELSRADMQRHRDAYDAQLTLSEGWLRQSVRQAKVDIFDSSGKDVFSLADAGPRTDVQLPPGRYRVLAQAGGKTVAGKLDVKAGGTAHARLHWVHNPVLG